MVGFFLSLPTYQNYVSPSVNSFGTTILFHPHRENIYGLARLLIAYIYINMVFLGLSYSSLIKGAKVLNPKLWRCFKIPP